MADMIRIAEFEFERVSRPMLGSNGSWRELCWKEDAACLAALAEATPAGRVWTLVDADGFTLVLSAR